MTETITHLVCVCGQSGTLTMHEEGEKYLRKLVHYSVTDIHWSNSRILVEEPYDDDIVFDKLMLYCPLCGERLGRTNVVETGGG